MTPSHTRTAASRLRLAPPSKDPYKAQTQKRYLFFFSLFSPISQELVQAETIWMRAKKYQLDLNSLIWFYPTL